MKDYTLSEAKKICEQHRTCGDCPLKIITQHGIGCMFWIMPRNWQNPIEPRDMIELPCKEHRVTAYCDVWDVYFRDKRYGFVAHDCRGTEAAADAFLEHLKGEKE